MSCRSFSSPPSTGHNWFVVNGLCLLFKNGKKKWLHHDINTWIPIKLASVQYIWFKHSVLAHSSLIMSKFPTACHTEHLNQPQSCFWEHSWICQREMGEGFNHWGSACQDVPGTANLRVKRGKWGIDQHLVNSSFGGKCNLKKKTYSALRRYHEAMFQ